MKRQRRLSDGYSFAGFRAPAAVHGVFKRCAAVAVGRRRVGMTGVRQVRDLRCGPLRVVLELKVRRVECRNCGTVKRERLDFLADNPRYTKRFAFYVGRRCQQASIRDVAKEVRLDWETVKTLEKQYVQAQLARAGRPGPRAISIDEISVRKGHSYRIVVSDLARKRSVWFDGQDRSSRARRKGTSELCAPRAIASRPGSSFGMAR
jgi:transposase